MKLFKHNLNFRITKTGKKTSKEDLQLHHTDLLWMSLKSYSLHLYRVCISLTCVFLLLRLRQCCHDQQHSTIHTTWGGLCFPVWHALPSRWICEGPWWWSSYILWEPESPWHYIIKVAISNLSLDTSPQISIDYPFVLSSLHLTAARPLSCVISVNLLSFCHLSLVTYYLLFPSIGICPLSLTKSSTFLPYLGIFYLLGGANLNLLIQDYHYRAIQLGSSSRQLKLTDFLLETSP